MANSSTSKPSPSRPSMGRRLSGRTRPTSTGRRIVDPDAQQQASPARSPGTFSETASDDDDDEIVDEIDAATERLRRETEAAARAAREAAHDETPASSVALDVTGTSAPEVGDELALAALGVRASGSARRGACAAGAGSGACAHSGLRPSPACSLTCRATRMHPTHTPSRHRDTHPHRL